MNKKGQHYHAHYTGDIPFMVWVLIIAVLCIGLGLIIPQLSTLLFIGIVLFVLWLGILIIAFLHDIGN